MEPPTDETQHLSKLRNWENYHLILWLAKDVSWLLNYKIMGMVMITPTLSLALFLCWYTRKQPKELAFNLAVASWISANGVWMVGEFFFNDSTRPLALWFFVAGFFFIGRYYFMLLLRKNN